MTGTNSRGNSKPKVSGYVPSAESVASAQENSSPRADEGYLEPSDPVNKETIITAPRTAGYLGSTSYLSVFEGYDHNTDITSRDTTANIRGSSQSTHAPPLTSTRTQEGSEVLSCLLNMSCYSNGLERWYKCRGLESVLPYVRGCITMVDSRSHNSSPKRLLEVAHLVGLHTAEPSPFRLDQTLQDFAKDLTGIGLCWEVVGIIISFGGLSAVIVHEVPDSDETDDRIDWMELSKRLLKASDKCLQFCSDYGHLNYLGVYLILINLILHSQVYGDAGEASPKYDGYFR